MSMRTGRRAYDVTGRHVGLAPKELAQIWGIFG